MWASCFIPQRAKIFFASSMQLQNTSPSLSIGGSFSCKLSPQERKRRKEGPFSFSPPPPKAHRDTSQKQLALLLRGEREHSRLQLRETCLWALVRFVVVPKKKAHLNFFERCQSQNKGRLFKAPVFWGKKKRECFSLPSFQKMHSQKLVGEIRNYFSRLSHLAKSRLAKTYLQKKKRRISKHDQLQANSTQPCD